MLCSVECKLLLAGKSLRCKEFLAEKRPRLIAEVHGASVDKIRRHRKPWSSCSIIGAVSSSRELRDLAEGLALATELTTNSITTNLVHLSGITQIKVRTNRVTFTDWLEDRRRKSRQ